LKTDDFQKCSLGKMFFLLRPHSFKEDQVMVLIKSFFATSPIVALFLCIALGYAIGKVRFGKFQLGGIVGTLFAAIVVGQVGVEVDQMVKNIAFALFIYSLGYVSGPQFFSSLGRNTLNQVHLAIFSSIVIFTTVWGLAHIFGLDKGTAAGLLAGATTESASVGTAGEALAHLGLASEQVKTLQANIGVTYAVTYLFGFTLVVFFVSVIAPRMMGVNLKDAAKNYESDLGDVNEDLDVGQEKALRDVLVRIFRITNQAGIGMTVAEFEEKQQGTVVIQALARNGRRREFTPEFVLAAADKVELIGKRDPIMIAGSLLGEETSDVRGMGFVSETLDVVLSNKVLVGAKYSELRERIDPELRRGAFVTKLVRSEHAIELRPHTRLQAGDVLTLYGPIDAVTTSAKEIGYAMDRGLAVDYVYLGLGIITGVLIGMITIPVAGSPVALHTGGGCLISGLIFGWLRSKHPTFGRLPAATALHLKDFGLAIFVASVGLAVGPQALALLKEQGIMLPALSVTVVLVPLISSMYYAKYVLKMDPVVICGALAGVLTCTAGLNAAVAEAGSETPVLGYTVPYAISNVLLTLLGPVIVLTV
jgi:putative transport protein